MPEKLRNIYEAELERLASLLPKAEPGSEEYSRLFYIMGDLEYRLERLNDRREAHSDDPADEPATEPPAPTPVDEPAEEKPEEEAGEYINPEDLRASLADAKKKGVNISELISSLGAPNFSGLRDDQNKLRQLKTKMEKALEEL